jgi:hypothetical protein
MHHPDLMKSAQAFHETYNVKRHVELERELNASVAHRGKPPFKRFLHLMSLFSSSMSGTTVNDWFAYQFNSKFLSKIDKDFLLDYVVLADASTDGHDASSYELDTMLARMNISLSVLGNRVKTSKQPVDTVFDAACLKRFNAVFGSRVVTWDDYIMSLLNIPGGKGYELLIVLMKAIFLSGYSDTEYQGG